MEELVNAVDVAVTVEDVLVCTVGVSPAIGVVIADVSAVSVAGSAVAFEVVAGGSMLAACARRRPFSPGCG